MDRLAMLAVSRYERQMLGIVRRAVLRE